MPRRLFTFTCAWCGRQFKSRSGPNTRTCNRKCTGHYIAMKRSSASYREAGHRGGTRAGQRRRQAVVDNFTKLLTGPMRQFGTCLYIVGFMHGQNTAAIRYRREIQRLRKLVDRGR